MHPTIKQVFAFGTLKRGFALHEQGLSGAEFLGLCETRERYPMLVAGPWFAPMTFNTPNLAIPVRSAYLDLHDDRRFVPFGQRS